MNRSTYNGYYQPSVSAPVSTPSQIIKHQNLNDQAIELTQTINNSHEVLAQSRTIFPFTLFPDEITIDREKLTIDHRDFFWTGEVMSIRIEDILNVTADTGPIFGSLKISTRFFATDKPYLVNWLSRKDALKMKYILQGYVIARQKKIECSTLPARELAHMLYELGR